MGKEKLREKLSYEMKQNITIEKTEELINAHKTTYKNYWNYVYSIRHSYQQGQPLMTSDGFVLWPDNPIVTSASNFPIQANSASITRLAKVLAFKKNLKVMCSLHDALYLYMPSENYHVYEKQLQEVMIQATAQILGQSTSDCTIRIDVHTIQSNDLFIDDKGEADWKQLKQYFNRSTT